MVKLRFKIAFMSAIFQAQAWMISPAGLGPDDKPCKGIPGRLGQFTLINELKVRFQISNKDANRP